MNKTKDFLIQFIGLKLGKHHFEYLIDNKFFEIFDYHEYNNSSIKVNVILEKKSTLIELAFKHKGIVNVPCDMTNEEFDLPINGKMKMIVRFGDAFNNDNEELLILPHGEFQIDISQYIYEMVVLSVPQKRIHPGVKDGSLKTEALTKLKELTVNEIKESNNIKQFTENIDPRWDKLKQLLTDK